MIQDHLSRLSLIISIQSSQREEKKENEQIHDPYEINLI